jgi:thiol-disulfide isomerase/thioredoxin
MSIRTLILLFLIPTFAHAQTTLHIGDAAPGIQYSKWLKGTPVIDYAPGHLYVLEFWATWCGPCKKAMPHVSEVSRKYAGKAEFIGVSVWERPKKDQDISSQVAKFVKSNDSIMDFNVAMEDGEWMAKNWLDPAGVIGIPATMIIDALGQVAWIGAPWDVEMPLAELLQGKYDMKKYALKYQEEQEKNIQMMADYKQARPLSDSLKKLVDANNYSEAIKV